MKGNGNSQFEEFTENFYFFPALPIPKKEKGSWSWQNDSGGPFVPNGASREGVLIFV